MKHTPFEDIELLDVGHTIQIVGGVYADGDNMYICLFPNEHEKDAVLLDMDLEDWKKFIRQTDLLETEMLKQGPVGVTKAIVRKSQRQIDTHVMWSVFKRDEYKCRYCGIEGSPLTIDHLVLWEVGGPTIEENLLTSCKPCNRHRGNTKYEDWLNSEKYKSRSRQLTDRIKADNLALADTLSEIDRVKNIRTR